MTHMVLVSLALLLLTGAAGAATEVEMEACKLTPEVKKELKLTAVQEPKVKKVFSDLAPMLEQIEKAMQKRQELRQSKAAAASIEETTKNVIALENQCRERLHVLLKPVLTDAQSNTVLEMEEVHRKKVRERQALPSPGAGGPSAGRPAGP